MKQISYEELGKYISDRATLYFEKWYSKELKDYYEDIVEEYNEENDVYYCYVELHEFSKPPLIIRFYTRYVYNKKGDIVDTLYYI